jgi:nucleotide-binding universal stress UspA family protein
MNTILLGTDGSPASRRATEVAIGLARATSSPLRIVSAWTLPAPTLAFAMPFEVRQLEDFERERAERAVRAAAELAVRAEIATQTGVAGGDPVDVICTEAESCDAALVVVGSRGWSNARRMLLGSVSLAVLAHAERPVLVVRGDVEVDFKHPKILIATDGSPSARRAAATALELAQQTGWPLYAVAVWTLSPNATVVANGLLQELIRLARGHAIQVLEELAHLADAAGVDVHRRLAGGPPDAAICEEATDLGATIVVLGSRGLGAGKRMVFGSVSNAVVHDAPCPVLVVRAGKPVHTPHSREAAAAAQH